MTLGLWFLSQESLPHPGLVLGWLFVCQHERVHCRDSGRWASSSIPPSTSPPMTSFNQVNICTAVYHQCHSSACQQNTQKPRASPAVIAHRTKQKADLKHLLLAFQTAYISVRRSNLSTGNVLFSLLYYHRLTVLNAFAWSALWRFYLEA